MNTRQAPAGQQDRRRPRAARRAAIAAGGLLLAAGLEVITYPRWRAWCLTWGATPGEAAGALPGDELLPEPGIVSTRAIRVDAPPSAIWPWLVQMGPGRGGAYTYDWIENLFGLGMHSADEVLPSSRTSRSATRSSWAGGGRRCGRPSWSRGNSSSCAPTTATGCGRSRWPPTAPAPG